MTHIMIKPFVATLALLTATTFSVAQDQSKTFSKNSSAYSVKEVKYNSKKNDYCAVKFFDAVVFTSARKSRSKKQSARTEEKKARLYTTEKTSRGSDRKPKLFLPDLKTRYVDGPICFNKEFTMVYFSRNHFKNSPKSADGTYKYKLFESRLNIQGIDTVIKFPYNSNDYNIMHPSVSLDGNLLFFASDMPGGQGGMDIYFSKKSGGTWGTPINLGNKVNTGGNEVFPFIAANNILYFSSDRPGGMGGLDIYESKLKDDKGKKAFNMGEPVNSKNDDFGFYLTYGTGFISSSRKNDGKDDDLYELEVLKEVKRGKDALIVAKDKASGVLLPNTKLIINDETVTTDEKGEYTLMVEEEMTYKLRAQKEDYFDAEESITSLSSPDDEFTKELRLEKDPKLLLTAVISDAQTGQPLEGVSVKIKDLSAGKDPGNHTTAANGAYSKPLPGRKIGDKLRYTITLEKPGYLQKILTYESTVAKAGEVNLNENVNLSLGKVMVGADLSKLIEIKPIYFDLGKPTIRPDAAIELDKIVAVMNEYPNMSIELGSHTDCRSAAALNLKLSAARAKTSAAYIVKKGIAANRITGKGYGETKLLNNCACEGKISSNCSEEEHTKNRRTEFLVTKMQ
jgi:outer membrane protein OmpA-like peptidoglycan-associated protein